MQLERDLVVHVFRSVLWRGIANRCPYQDQAASRVVKVMETREDNRDGTTAPGWSERKQPGVYSCPPRGRKWKFQSNTTRDRKSTRLNSSHVAISYAVF